MDSFSFINKMLYTCKHKYLFQEIFFFIAYFFETMECIFFGRNAIGSVEFFLSLKMNV